VPRIIDHPPAQIGGVVISGKADVNCDKKPES
jgi:hypothetical protein